MILACNADFADPAMLAASRFQESTRLALVARPVIHMVVWIQAHGNMVVFRSDSARVRVRGQVKGNIRKGAENRYRYTMAGRQTRPGTRDKEINRAC